MDALCVNHEQTAEIIRAAKLDHDDRKKLLALFARLEEPEDEVGQEARAGV